VVRKILHPKTRLEKLGIKPNAAGWFLVGRTSKADFLGELRSVTKNVNVTGDGRGKAGCGCGVESFFSAASSKELSQVAKLANGLKGCGGAVDCVPEGAKSKSSENDVLAAGRKCGLKDIRWWAFRRRTRR